MTGLLEFREKLRGFYVKYGVWIVPVTKFLFGLTVFWQINDRLGYMLRLHSVPLVLILALACSVLPVTAMLLAAGGMITLH